jgi:exosortase/archaeosortase family protein
MLVRGQLVIVDAPCSGVQMAWMAYFVACGVAAMTGLRDGHFVRRLPLIGLLVLVGNTVRNSVLVALESRPARLSAGAHEAIGLVALLAVCALVVRLINQERSHAHAA